MVDGLKSLSVKLTKTIPAEVRKRVRSAMAVAADQIVAEMESRAPELSGDLVASIGWVWGVQVPNGAFSFSTIQSGANPEDTITIFAGSEDAYYARWQEFGTKNMAANPFFFVSYRVKRRSARSRVTRAIKQGLRDGSR